MTSRIIQLCLFFQVILFISFNQISFAAQDAVVSTKEAAIREKPNAEAAILENKIAGTKLRISSFNKDGWYKTKTSTGASGWIWQADLAINTQSGDVIAANIEIKEKTHEHRKDRDLPSFYIKGGGLLFAIIPGDLNHRLAVRPSYFFLAPGAFGEASVRLSDRLWLALRAAYYQTSSILTANGTVFTVTHSGIPLLVGLNTEFAHSETFDFMAGFYGGIGFANSVKVTASDLDAPNSFSLQSSQIAALINFTSKYHLSRKTAVTFEIGGYFSYIPKTTLTERFNGDAIFRDGAGGLSNIMVNHVGPMMSVGLEYTF